MSEVRGWCPSAHRPMMSGDGLIVRVQPRLARLSASDLLALCDLSDRHGNGLIDFTSRGNIQLRGVSEVSHPVLLSALIELGLVSMDPRAELPLTVTPFWTPGSISERLAGQLGAVLAELPPLPAKVGIVVDAEPARRLADVSGDFRFEHGEHGLMLRADGASRGWPIKEAEVVSALQEMATWFVENGGVRAGRMRRLLTNTTLPDNWQVAEPAKALPVPGPDIAHGMIGLAFGRAKTTVIRKIIDVSGVSDAFITPWRLLRLDWREADIPAGRADISAGLTDVSDIITDISDVRARIDVCPGAPLCASAHIETVQLAGSLAGQISGRLHVSGCSKGCARQRPADVTIIGTSDGFDLVLNGRAGDTPVARSLTVNDLHGRLKGMAC